MNIELLKEVLEQHGEVHAIFEEQEVIAEGEDEPYVGIRNSENVEFHDEHEAIEINDGRKSHYIDYERLVYFTPANEFPD